LTDLEPLEAKSLLATLEEVGVEFVVIGGFAVSAHGELPATKDLEIVPDPDPENLARLAVALDRLGAQVQETEDFSPDEVVQPDADGLRMGGNFVLNTDHGRLDVLQFVAPELEYAELRSAAIEDLVFGHKVRFCGFDHLVAMKEAVGRPEDLLDLRRLREARGE
jgi:hypothetical protein